MGVPITTTRLFWQDRHGKVLCQGLYLHAAPGTVTALVKRFASCRVRCLVLSVNSYQPGLAVAMIGAAARNNPTLVEFAIVGGAPRQYADTWGWRDLELPHVERATIEENHCSPYRAVLRNGKFGGKCDALIRMKSKGM